ncbi:MAG: hypothetical protein R3E66_14515 [bacterium]
MRLILAVLLLASMPAFAADSPGAGIRSAFDAGTGALGALKRSGATLDTYSVAERLPDGSWLVDARFALDGNTLRLPVKLNDAFDLSWAPVSEYGDALVGMTRSGALPQVQGTPWGSRKRLPAFPVVVTGKRIVTVFGVIPFEPSLKVEPDETLVLHTQRWIHETMADDPAPASFDVLAAGNLAWIDVVRVVYSISATGLFEMNFVGPGTTTLASISGLSPVVFSQMAEVQGVITLGVTALKDTTGFRVAISGALQEASPKTCDPDQTFCASSKAEFDQGLGDVPGIANARFVVAPEYGMPFQRVVEVTGWANDMPVLSIVAP